MARRQLREHAASQLAEKRSVFLNLPYDSGFRKLFLAYIGGTNAFGLIPRATLELPGGARRLDRISSLIQSCRYSIHDMSRVQLDRTPPQTPRFNMPLELGLTVGHNTGTDSRHTWFVFETRQWRLQKSLSDLKHRRVRSWRNAEASSDNCQTHLSVSTSGVTAKPAIGGRSKTGQWDVCSK